ncbi:hypothetical protein PINS_up018866 [Pythium insidiosum]|nr:hypothetical protein PINS_up018866 [Pythium insidiosum]
MALIQVLDLDAVRPKVSLLPDCGLSDANPPTCMAVLEPRFLKSIYPEVLLGTSDRSLVTVSKESGVAVDTDLRDALNAPISRIAIAPTASSWRSSRRTAFLTVMNTMLDKKILTFDTQSKTSPLAMCWCGEDAVCSTGPNRGYHGRTLRLLAAVPVLGKHRARAGDGLLPHLPRVSHDIVIRVPSCVEHIKGVGSQAAAAMLFQAMRRVRLGRRQRRRAHALHPEPGDAAEGHQGLRRRRGQRVCTTPTRRRFCAAPRTARTLSTVRSRPRPMQLLNGNATPSNRLGPELFPDMCRKIRVLTRCAARTSGSRSRSRSTIA